MKSVSLAKTLFLMLFWILVGVTLLATMACAQEYRTVAIPKNFKSVKFSQDGDRVAFGVEQNGKFHAIVDGKAGPLYDDVTVIEFSPKGNHYYYGGKRDGKYYLVIDGKEVAELGGLTSLTQGTSLHFIGGEYTVTMWSTLAIWFAEKADNYFVLCYPKNTGKIFKDGSWLPVEFQSFWHEGMAFSSDGNHYSFAVSPLGSRRPTVYIDGIPGPQFDSIDGTTYLQPGNRLVYRGERNGNWILMEGDRALQGYGPLADTIKASTDHMHLAVLVKKEGGKQAAVVDGKEETAFPKIDWGYAGFISRLGSFVWNKDFTAHAYVAYLTNEKTSAMVVVHNGKSLGARSEIRGSSLSISDDGKHVAYAIKDKDKWAIVVDEAAKEAYEEVGDPIFMSTEGKIIYAAKTAKGWVIKGLPESVSFLDVGPLIRGPKNEIAYAAKIEGGKWQVFLNDKPFSNQFDGIVTQAWLRFDSSGSLRFVAKDGDKLIWVRGK